MTPHPPDTASPAEHIRHVQDEHGGAFVIDTVRGRVAELTYQRLGAALIVITHTGVDTSLRGRGIARQLLEAAVHWARQSGTGVRSSCSYVTAQFAADPALADVHVDRQTPTMAADR